MQTSPEGHPFVKNIAESFLIEHLGLLTRSAACGHPHLGGAHRLLLHELTTLNLRGILRSIACASNTTQQTINNFSEML
eukprot:4382369-Amphidinium_carterae.1